VSNLSAETVCLQKIYENVLGIRETKRGKSFSHEIKMRTEGSKLQQTCHFALNKN
jgi:hypothetical protein